VSACASKIARRSSGGAAAVTTSAPASTIHRVAATSRRSLRRRLSPSAHPVTPRPGGRVRDLGAPADRGREDRGGTDSRPPRRSLSWGCDTSQGAKPVLNDTDVWPVTCQTCGYITHKEIGWLKHSTSITCGQCGHGMRFHTHLFSQVIEELRKSIELAAGNGVFTDKTP
jgi:hypothetical protein